MISGGRVGGDFRNWMLSVYSAESMLRLAK